MASLSPPPAPPVYSEISEKKLKSQPEATFRLFHDIVFTQRSVLPPPSFVSANILPALARHLKSAPPSGTKKNEIHVADLALDVVSVLPCSDELTEVLTTTYAQIPTPCIKAGVLRHLPVALTSPKLEEFVTKQLPSSYNKPATTPETCSLRRCEMTFLRRVASLGSSATASSSHALQLLIKGCDDKKNFESALEELGLVDYDDGLRKMVVDTRGKALEKLLENAIKICGELDKADKAPAKKTKGAAVTGGKKTATSSASSSSTPSGHIASLSSGVLSLSVLSLLSSTHLANSSSLVNDKKSFLHTTPSYHLSPLASPPALRAYTRILRRCAEGDLALRRLTIVAMEATDGDVRREGKRQLREVVATSMDKTITVVDTMFGNLLRASQAEKEEGQHWKTAKDNRVRIEPCDAGGSRYLTGWKEGQTDRVKKTARGISRDILKRKDATDTDTGTDTDTDTDTDRNLPPATFLLPFLDSSAKPLPTKHFRAAFSSIFGAESFSQTPFVDAVLQALKSSVLNSAASKFLQFACLEAENFEEGYDTLTDTNRHEFNSRLFAKSVAENLRGEVEETVSTLSEIPGEDAHLLKILEGRLYEGDAGNGNANSSVKENKNVKRDVKKKKNKGDFGAEAEEEEWARELEKEREKAKLAEANKEERIYSKEELQTIEKQSLTRKSIQAKLDKLTLLANAINSMCSASLSITNEILLPIFSPVILPLHCSAKNPIPFFLSPFSSTLNLLSDSILEMDPSASLPLSRALILSQNGHLPFQPASSSLVATVVSTLDDFSDALSPPSFAYVLPVLHSILNSRRTLPGCDGALRIMDRQKREEDSVRTHRYSVTSTLLTLLSFDRRMNFTNPTVSETLTNFFDLPGNEPTEEEISLLLSTSGVLHADSNVRSAALGALKNALKHHPTSQPHAEIFLTSFDDDEAIASLAATCEIKPSSVFISTFVQVLNNEQVCDEVKRSAAKAVAEIMRTQGVQNTIVILTENFLTFAPAEFDDDKKNDKKKSKKELEMQLMMGSNAKSSKEEGKDNGDKIQKRCSTLLALSSIGSTPDLPLATADTINLMTFLIDYGLCDPNETVRAASASAGQKIIATYGAPSLDDLLPLFEKVLSTGASLNSSQKINNTVAAQDHRKEGAVVLLGSGALHLHNENDSDKISATVDMLLGALKTPSESVQRSVADCLVPLCKKGDTGSRAESIVDGLMKDALRDDSLAVRRGSAYGVSAVVKGLGISSLKKYDIVTRLEEGCGKTNPMMKEGSLFCIELLCSRLGMLFEPYVKGLLPALLKCFGDGSDHVRDAASAASSLIMAKLSSHGVKLIMPSVLAAFEDNAWRTKQASIRMLGAMSNCAPKQLATCLPKIVPALTQAFGDTHPKVKESAETALKQIKNVIRNPEIKTLAPVLLKGLTDPAKSTKKALDALLETEFLHAIDAPSLALLIPILQRGLKDRVGTSKRKSALVCGSMCTMIAEPRDFSPYLGVLLPGLQSVLLDPIPDVRSTSAKAIGALVRGLGESEMPDLRGWLIETLKSESGTSVERSGAAQGLCELLIACGGTTVHEVMKSEILPLSTHPRGNVREGVLWVLTFLPTSLGNGFASLIDDALPAVLTGLNDEVEPVREVAMRAGKVLIRSHGRTSVGQIVPPLEEGMEDPNWRIRQSSLMLLGDLLTMIGGTNVVGVAEIGGEDDTRGAEKAQAQIALVLGSETRKRVLSKLYIARSDTSSVVRQGAVQVWKSIVSVTPRTLREILPLLVSHIVISLSGGGDQSGSEDRTIVASRCLGDLVKKLGEKVLPEIIPILTNKLNDVEKETRMGVCIGLGEVISCGNKEQIVKYLDVLIPAVRASLVDAEDSVRKVGALAFQKLYSVIGGERVFTDIVPVLMSELDEEEEGGSLEGLKEVLKLKSKELLPMLIPKLLVHPITRTNAIVLENICEVTGGTIHFHFGRIVAEITTSISEFDGSDEPREESIKNAFRSACRNVDSTGINWLCSELATRCSSDKAAVRRAAIWMVGAFAEERKSEQDFYEELPILIRETLSRLNDDDSDVVLANVSTLKAVYDSAPAEEITKHLDFTRNLINSLVSESRRRKGGVGDGLFLLPGFNVKNGLNPLLPMLTHSILYGSGIARETAAACLGEFIELTASKFLAGPVVIKMTGPLIRVVGDRNSSSVKGALVKSLGIILGKGGPALRAFVPQLQTTFVKALSDPKREVRVEATRALGMLMPLSTRVDPLITELVGLSMPGEVAVRTAAFEALAVVVMMGGKKVKKPEIIEACVESSASVLGDSDQGLRDSAAKALGACYSVKSEADCIEFIQDKIESRIFDNAGKDEQNETYETAAGYVSALRRVVDAAAGMGGLERDLMVNLKAKVVDVSAKWSRSHVRESCGGLVGSLINAGGQELLEDLAGVVVGLMEGEKAGNNSEINKAVCAGCTFAAIKRGEGVEGECIFISKNGAPIVKQAIKLALTGNSRVQQYANVFLKHAFGVDEKDSEKKKGKEMLDRYGKLVSVDDSKKARELFAKVFSKIKGEDLEVIM